MTARRVDHVVHAVHDLDRAAAAYREAGFLVTQRADHPFGTSNRLVVLDGSYLELVAITDPDRLSGPFAAFIRHFLQTRSGLAFLVLRSEYAAADHSALHPTGLAVGEVATFSRPATLPGGRTVEASFSLVFTPGFPDLGLFLCQHHTPEAIWDPDSLRHPNGASRLAGLEGRTGESAGPARTLGTLTGAEPVEVDGEVHLSLRGSLLRLRIEFGLEGPVLDGLVLESDHHLEVEIEGCRIRSASAAPPA